MSASLDRRGALRSEGILHLAALSVLVAAFWIAPELWGRGVEARLATVPGTLLAFFGAGALTWGYSATRPVPTLLRFAAGLAVLALQAHAVLEIRAGVEPSTAGLLVRCHLAPLALGALSALDESRSR